MGCHSLNECSDKRWDVGLKRMVDSAIRASLITRYQQFATNAIMTSMAGIK